MKFFFLSKSSKSAMYALKVQSFTQITTVSCPHQFADASSHVKSKATMYPSALSN
jgi:hypothetical protein